MSEEIEAEGIARSSHRIEREVFGVLLNLSQIQPWLQRKQSELLDTLELCEDFEEKSLVCNMLSRVTYMSGEKFRNSIENIARQICKIWGLKASDTKIVARNKTRYSDSSEAVLWMLKAPLAEFEDWSTTNLLSNMSEVVNEVINGGNIVFVDDFVGSGESILKATKWINGKLLEAGKTANIFLCSIASMQGSRAAIEAQGVSFFSDLWLERGISDYFKGDELVKAIERMKRLESELEPQVRQEALEKYYFGYKRTEALYYLDGGNAPNNVFPLFWWPELRGKIVRTPMMRRL